MNKRLIFILILLTNSLFSFSQVSVSGTVIGKDDKLSIPGVSVVVKGAEKIGTTTNIEGAFSLTIPDTSTALIFSFVGMKSQEYNIESQEHILIKMKSECFVDFFDQQEIDIYLISGVVNNPVGGQLDLSIPAFIRQITIKSGISYQTNFDHNEFINAKIEFNHIIATCDFSMDMKSYYRKNSFENSIYSNVYSLEIESNIDLRSNWYKLIVGYNKLEYENRNTNINQSSHGLSIGLGTWIPRPLNISIIGKVSIYQENIEYFGQMNRQFKRIYTFAKFYKLDTFTELSFGIGINMSYRFKNQRM